MESTRDIRRMIEKEIKKGSAPLTFDTIAYPREAIQEIDSELKLKEVLVYLLRIAEFENLANDMTRNNVYTENHLIHGDSFHRRNNVMERNANYLNVITYAKRCKPDYEHKTFVESVICYFDFPKEEIGKYRFVYEDKETYAFPLSGKHIINGLYLMSIMYRKAMAFQEMPDFITQPEHQEIFQLSDIRKVLFQCLLLDDMRMTDAGQFQARLHTIYLLKEGLECSK